ncbi:YunC family protein [Candidatus Bathyarchaeota archaeon]|nr:YunC family protein [Candidatus Bathyarchaeota archaeon]MBS7636132.1 YunC family protein [Candidatus Bathyarchaeota archaeon]
MCGFLNIEAAERLDVAAAMVSGVKTFEDVLNAEVKAATTKAKRAGVQPGMRGEEALKRML